jgi:hypothetical protein
MKFYCDICGLAYPTTSNTDMWVMRLAEMCLDCIDIDRNREVNKEWIFPLRAH